MVGFKERMTVLRASIHEKAFDILQRSNDCEIVETYQEIKDCTIDFAKPQSWADKAQELDIEPSLFVWCYDNNTGVGRPLSKSQILSTVWSYTYQKMIKDESDGHKLKAVV